LCVVASKSVSNRCTNASEVCSCWRAVLWRQLHV